ncbi:peptidoglycan editing factor PgeF [Aquibaculum sediminis]|uniref:peptidoglycan editing factor PgeF n=1 Tax=Aquibaculum sediminis TaxID=3231907 RepID=UPI0034560275
MLTIGPFNAVAGLRHAFFTREGGVSQGIYDSLNCGPGSKDNPDHVAENRRRAAAALGLEPDRLLTCYQVHSPNVVTVEEPWNAAERPEADGLVTATPGLALGILTADCAPVLLADAQAGVIGAAHAGWKGAVGGVLEATVDAMEALGARRDAIIAGIGPCIAQRSYEVGPDFPAPFLAQGEENRDLFRPGAGDRLHFDLKDYVARRLHRAGLRQVQPLPCDTCSEEERFFSYRRACLRGEPDYGRQLSAIALTT